MIKNSTGAKRRQGRKQAETGQVLAFPRRAPASPAEPDGQIVIDLRPDGLLDARLTGAYAEDMESVVSALEIVWAQAAQRMRMAASAKRNVLNFPSRRTA